MNILHREVSPCTSLVEIRFPETLVTAGSSAFKNCTSLKKLNLSSGMQEIDSDTFRACRALTDVTIPQSVTEISEHAFQECENLKTITLNEGLETIGYEAFAGCTSLQRLEIPDSVTSLGTNSIKGDSNLQYLSYGGGVKTIQSSYSVGITDSCLETVIFNEGITSINSDAFKNNPRLTAISLPESLTTISGGAFSGCNITSVYVPAGVNTIGVNAFTCPEDREYMVFYGLAGSQAERYANSSQSIRFYAVTKAIEQDNALQLSDEISVSPEEPVVYLGVGQKYAQPHFDFTGDAEFPVTVQYNADGRVVRSDVMHSSIYGSELGETAINCVVSLADVAGSGIKLDASFDVMVVYDLQPSVSIGIGQEMEISPEIYVGAAVEQTGIDFRKVTWESDNTDIVEVEEVPGSPAVSIRAIASGSAGLTVRNNQTGAQTDMTVHVLEPPTDILFEEKELTLGVDETETIRYYFKTGEYSHVVTFESLDPSVASVSENGEVSAVKEGSTNVRVSAGGITRNVPVTVGPKPAMMQFKESNVSMLPKCHMTPPEIDMFDTDMNKAVGKILYSSSNENIVRVTNGKLYAVKAGTATIYAGTYVEGVEASLTVEVVSDESWTKLLEAEPKYNDVKQTLQERIERLNNGLKKKESQYAEKQKSKVLSSLESRIIIEHFSGEYKEFPREVKQKLYEVISNSLNNGSLDLKNVKTGKALCEKMFRAIAGSGQDTCLIEFKGKRYTYSEGTALGSSQLGRGVSMGSINDGEGTEWIVIIIGEDTIARFTQQLDVLAHDKVKDAIHECIKSVDKMMGIGEMADYLRMLARERDDTFMLFAINISGNVSDQIEDIIMKKLGFNSEKANPEEVADNSEYIKNQAKTIEKLFGLKYVDLKQEGEIFDPEKLMKDSKESIERFDTAVNFLYELF